MSVSAEHAYLPRVRRPVRVRPIGLAGAASVASSGLAVVLVGAWAGIVVFVGPKFDYRITSAAPWTWTTDNWLLHLVPGALAFAAGLFALGRAPSGRRGGVGLAAAAMALAGGWLVLGPVLWPWFEAGRAYGPAGGPGAAFLQQLGADLGPGLLLAFMAGLTYKAAHPGPVTAAPMAATPTVAAPAADGVPAASAPAAPVTEGDPTVTGPPAAAAPPEALPPRNEPEPGL